MTDNEQKQMVDHAESYGYRLAQEIEQRYIDLILGSKDERKHERHANRQGPSVCLDDGV